MVKKKVDNNISMVTSGWSFANIEKKFDNHIKKSIPYYEDIHNITIKISEFFNIDHSIFLDIGCSTGTLLKKFAKKYPKKNYKTKFIGIDSVASMIKEAKRINHDNRIKYINKSIENTNLKDINFISSIFTIQFVPLSKRQKIFNKIYKSLNKGGAFIMFEKVKAENGYLQEIYDGIYEDFKLQNHFTESEIIQKSLSLRGKMITNTSQENIEHLKKSGFKKINRIFKWFCFEGICCIK